MKLSRGGIATATIAILPITIVAGFIVINVPKGPRLKVLDIVDIGAVPPKSLYQSSFKIENTGDRALEIYSIQASCSCTLVNNGTKKLQPGEVADIRFAYSAGAQPREVAQSMMISCNDPTNRNKSVTLLGTIESAITLVPDRIQIIVQPEGINIGNVQLFVQESGASLKTVWLNSEAPFVRSQSIEVSAKRASIQIEVTRELIGELEIPISVNAEFKDGRILKRSLWLCGKAKPIPSGVQQYVFLNSETKSQTLTFGKNDVIRNFTFVPSDLSRRIKVTPNGSGAYEVAQRLENDNFTHSGCILASGPESNSPVYCVPVYLADF